MKLGSLFSGIGGFELAWQRQGGTVAWMCEIDKNARKVLAARFPGVPIYEDVQELDPAVVKAVDVLSGGSPCQGFSIAGARTGLLHGESRLFADYVRIMDGLEPRGLKWAVWENVPGVLSIKNPDGERTFPHVIAALAGSTVPVPLDPGRKWNAGVVAGAGRSVAWRIVDSRHFSVPQRRRRVYACVAVGDSDGSRAGRALLAVSEGVRRDPPACVTKGQGSSGGVGAGARVPSVAGTVSAKWAKGTGGPSGDEVQNLVTDSAQAFNWQSGGDTRGLQLTNQTSSLTTQQTPAVLMTMREGKPGGGKGPLLATEESLTLATGNGQTLFQPQAFDAYNQSLSETAPTVRAASGGDNINMVLESHFYGVRRLTPVECERLQAFPDGWTEPAGSDSARYKALGNAITVNVASWVFGRIVEVGA